MPLKILMYEKVKQTSSANREIEQKIYEIFTTNLGIS